MEKKMTDMTPLKAGLLTLDFSAVGVIAAAIFGWLPPIAAVLAILWYVIQIYESRTIQSKLRSRRLRRLVRLRAEAVALELAIRNQNFDLRGLDEANKVALAASTTAAVLTNDALRKEQAVQNAAGDKIADTVARKVADQITDIPVGAILARSTQRPKPE